MHAYMHGFSDPNIKYAGIAKASSQADLISGTPTVVISMGGYVSYVGGGVNLLGRSGD